MKCVRLLAAVVFLGSSAGQVRAGSPEEDRAMRRTFGAVCCGGPVAGGLLLLAAVAVVARDRRRK